MWRTIGGILGLLAILTLLVAVFQLMQDRNTAETQSNAQATQIALIKEQLDLSREMATIQAGGDTSPATATAAAARVSQLEATSAALGTSQAKVLISGASPTTTTPPLWNEQSSSVPEAGTQIIRELAADEFLYLTGGRFAVGNIFCGNDANQICVLIYEATHPQRIVIDQLVAQNNYLARTFWYKYDDLIRMHETFYWQWPNCNSNSGCSKASIYHIIDGQLVGGPIIITRP
jgi:hypothetical protein